MGGKLPLYERKEVNRKLLPSQFSLFAVSLLKMVDVNQNFPVMVVVFMAGDFLFDAS